jgi:hypothetical protein
VEALDSAALSQDSASLLRFVATVVSASSLQTDYPSYLKPSEDFFQSINTLGEATVSFLNDFPSNTPRDPQLHLDYRRKLTALRQGWTHLHEYVKPAIEAHTLGIPSPFIEALLYRFNQIPQFQSSSFALIHTHEVMYYQLRASWIRDRIKEISDLIGINSPFPPDLGIIALPYSQSGSLFLNCAIAHEIGHFAFQKLALRNQLAVDVVASVMSTLGPRINTVGTDDLRWIIETVLKWVEELFCDLFAIWLIGPCFSFSYIELFDMGYAMENATSRGPFLNFYSAHPADLLRLQQHRVMLEHLGWWRTFSCVDSHYVLVLERCQSLIIDDFGIVKERGDQIGTDTRTTFFNVIPIVHSKVNSLFVGLDSGVGEFEGLSSAVEKYLWNGVVPSTVFDKLALRFPRITTLLNTAAKVHISSLDKLLNQLVDGDPTSPKNRADWTTRLELWTIKALEDSVILERCGRKWG